MSYLPSSVLVANRGEIARRIIRTCQRLGVRAVAVHSEADHDLPFVHEADDAVCLGPAAPAASYLDSRRVLEVADETRCDAVHPGYGFLSENAEFARHVGEAGLTWIGPSPEAIAEMGDKVRARQLMASVGVPVGAGHGHELTDAADALAEAERIGYPVMLKASRGGGGIGMSAVHTAADLAAAFETTRARAERSFSSSAVFLEQYLPSARHIEVQILGLPDGQILTLGERDCSVQRRHQKIVEETPAPHLAPALRQRLLAAAVQAGRAVNYRNAGTVEFLVEDQSETIVFLEVNTRLQVEHPITELVTGIDLVEEQLRIAMGHDVSYQPHDLGRDGHAMEFRVYAEDPVRFFPSPGLLEYWREPVSEGVRVDSGYVQGNRVTPHYDPLLAKVCVHADSRDRVLERAEQALTDFCVEGVKTNLPFLQSLLRDPSFRNGTYDTGIVARLVAH